MLYLFDKRYFALLSFPLLSFALQKYIFASNTFLHQIHFCTAFVFCCAKNTAASNTFLHQMHFYTITMRSLAFSGQLCSMCGGMCVALLNIFLWKMWCWTFYKGKCDAEHFTKENVMLNIFLWKMYTLQKCILASNAFDAKMHLMPKCFWCKTAFDAKMHFGVHFPKENVQQSIKCIFAQAPCLPPCLPPWFCFLLCKKQIHIFCKT